MSLEYSLMRNNEYKNFVLQMYKQTVHVCVHIRRLYTFILDDAVSARRTNKLKLFFASSSEALRNEPEIFEYEWPTSAAISLFDAKFPKDCLGQNDRNDETLRAMWHGIAFHLWSDGMKYDVVNTCPVQVDERAPLLRKGLEFPLGVLEVFQEAMQNAVHSIGPLVVSAYAMSTYDAETAAVQREVVLIRDMALDDSNCLEKMLEVTYRLEWVRRDFICAAHRVFVHQSHWMDRAVVRKGGIGAFSLAKCEWRGERGGMEVGFCLPKFFQSK